MLLSDDLFDVKNILKHLFWLFYNSKTNGTLDNGQNTYANQGIEFLRKRIANGVVDQYLTVGSLHINLSDEYDSADTYYFDGNTNDADNYMQNHKKGPFYEVVREIALKSEKQV